MRSIRAVRQADPDTGGGFNPIILPNGCRACASSGVWTLESGQWTTDSGRRRHRGSARQCMPLPQCMRVTLLPVTRVLSPTVRVACVACVAMCAACRWRTLDCVLRHHHARIQLPHMVCVCVSAVNHACFFNFFEQNQRHSQKMMTKTRSIFWETESKGSPPTQQQCHFRIWSEASVCVTATGTQQQRGVATLGLQLKIEIGLPWTWKLESAEKRRKPEV